MEQEQILYKLELDDSQLEAQLNKTTSSLIKSDAAVKQLNASLKQTENEIAQLDKELAENGKLTAEQEKRLQGLRQSQVQQTQALVQQRSESSRLRGEQNNLLKQYTNLEGSNNRLRGQLSVLTAQYNALSREQRLNTKEGLQLQNQIKAISDELKRNESAVGDNRRNVGNYANTIREAFAGTVQFGQGLGGIGNAISAGPFGLLAFALTSVVGLFQKSQPLLDFFEVKLGGISNIISNLTTRAGLLFSAFGSLLSGDLAGAADQASQAFDNLGGSIQSAFEAGQRLAELQQQIDDQNILNEVSGARANAQIAKLNAQLRDRTRTDQDRIRIAREIQRIEEEQFKLEDQNARLQLNKEQALLKEALRAQGVQVDGITNTTKLIELAIKQGIKEEEFLRLKEAQVKVFQLEGESLALIERTQTRLNAIQQQGAEEAARNAEKRTAEQEKQAKALEAQAKAFEALSQAELNASLQVIDRTFKEQQDALRELQAQGLITEQQFADESVALQATKLQRQIQEIQDYAGTVTGTEELIAQKQIELSDLVTEARIADFKRLYDEQKKQADEALKEEQARQQAFQQAVTSQLQGVAQASQQLANDLINNQQAVFATFSKNVLTSTLDVIERVLIAESVAAIGIAKIKDIALFGPAGLITAAIKIAGISAAFGIAKAGVQSALSFHTGGVVPQSSNGRLNRGGDDTLALVKSGEVIANDAQQSRIEAIAGPDIWARAGIPGFNAGGFVPPAPADIPTPAIDLSSANLVVSVRDIDSQLANVRVTQNRRTL